MSNDYEAERKRIEEVVEQRTDELHSFLNKCGLSGEQIHKAMQMFLGIMESDRPLSTIIKQDIAELQRTYEAEREQRQCEYEEERAARKQEREGERAKVFDPPAKITVFIGNHILIPMGVTASSIEDAEKKGLEAFSYSLCPAHAFLLTRLERRRQEQNVFRYWRIFFSIGEYTDAEG